MTNKELKAEAREIVISVGGLDSDESISLYEQIIDLAEEHAKAVQYEAEAKLDALTEVNVK